jgi:hypothetical protein
LALRWKDIGSLVTAFSKLARLGAIEEALMRNYLKSTRLQRALILNFGTASLEYKRLVLNLRESAQSADPLYL